VPAIGDLAHPDVPTCLLTDTVAEAQTRTKESGWDRCVVVNDRRIVLGLLAARELKRAGEVSAEEAMQLGPSTFRPNVSLEEMVEYMRHEEIDGALVTTLSGELVGFLPRAEAEHLLHQRHTHHHDKGRKKA
jgi:CBS domain-containing protein